METTRVNVSVARSKRSVEMTLKKMLSLGILDKHK